MQDPPGEIKQVYVYKEDSHVCVRGHKDKVVKVQLKGAADSMAKEVLILTRVSHPNLMRAECSLSTGFTAVMPRGLSFRPKYSQSFKVLRDVLKGLIYLHSLGWAHGDVKLSNMVILDGRGVLIDFGFLKLSHEIGPTGTLSYYNADMSELLFATQDLLALCCVITRVLRFESSEVVKDVKLIARDVMRIVESDSAEKHLNQLEIYRGTLFGLCLALGLEHSRRETLALLRGSEFTCGLDSKQPTTAQDPQHSATPQQDPKHPVLQSDPEHPTILESDSKHPATLQSDPKHPAALQSDPKHPTMLESDPMRAVVASMRRGVSAAKAIAESFPEIAFGHRQNPPQLLSLGILLQF